MTTIELKKSLIQQITEINDVSFLMAIKTILDGKSKKGKIVLTAEVRNEIKTSKAEIKNGNFVEQKVLGNEICTILNL